MYGRRRARCMVVGELDVWSRKKTKVLLENDDLSFSGIQSSLMTRSKLVELSKIAGYLYF